MARRIALASAVMALAAASCGRGAATALRERACRANNLGVALLEQFDYAGAAGAFREALRIDPSLALAHVNLSIALLYAPDLTNAGKEAAEAARLMPAAPQPPYVLGLIAREENRDDDAVRFFERVRAIDPRDVGSAINLAQIYLQDRKYAEAIAMLRPAASDEPYNVTAAYSLGLALTRAGQVDEGRRMMERSQALRATGYGTTLSNTYLEQGHYAEALASTGAEPDVVDARTPRASFAASVIVPPAPGGAAARSPFGVRFSTAELSDEGARQLAAGLGGSLTLIDFDGDGDLDLFIAEPNRQRLFRNDGGRFTDVTSGSGLEITNGVGVGCVAGDYDNDGMPDLFVLRYGRSSLYHNDGRGHFTDVTSTVGLPPYPHLPGAAAFVDVDHDGDLDIVIAGLADVAATRDRTAAAPALFPRDFAPAPLQLLRNNGNGSFTDITRAAGLQAATHAIGIVPTDFDNRRDIDLLIVSRDRPPMLFKNQRDGTFRDVAAEVGLAALVPGDDEIASVAAGDANKDDYPDFFFGRATGPGVWALSDGRRRFNTTPAPDGTRAAMAAQFVDYDNDGLLDLLTWSGGGPRMLRNLGRRWSDVTDAAFGRTKPLTSWTSRSLAIADVDGNGTSDLMTNATGTGAVLLSNSGDARHQFVRVRLKGRVSNRSGAGSKVQLRAGSLSQRIETSAATPAVAPSDVVFGIGERQGADVVRVLWPSGVLQAEYGRSSSDPAAPPPIAAPVPLRPTLVVEELNRKPSSCPFLFAWNGERFEFVTDFMGAGEMGYWEGAGARNRPDPLEYVRIRGDELRPKDGRYEIRVTNELEETLFVDRLQLISIEHPIGVDVFPNEGMSDPPKPFRLHAVADTRPPARAIDDHGHDVTAAVARIDRRYPDDFDVKPIRGFAAAHTLTLDLGDRSRPVVLLLTGWTDYAFSSDNFAGHQAGWTLKPPALEIRNQRGRWRTAIADIGIPVGRPQTIALDLTGLLKAGEREVRIATNMRVYWDQILVATPVASDRLRIDRIDPQTADLRERGFSKELRPDGREPVVYDYSRITRESPWKVMTGRYTRPGNVRPLLLRADDMFVVSKPGDEIALSFTAPVRTLPAGWTRTFLLLADGFSKEMDINSASPDRVEPLPFHLMTHYPYAPPEHYPDGTDYERYRAEFNTRVVPRD